MHIHLDPVGGIAGDMFAATLLNARPELVPDLIASFATANLDKLVRIEHRPHRDHALAG